MAKKLLEDRLYNVVEDGNVRDFSEFTTKEKRHLRIVVMGGGTGVPNVIEGLRDYIHPERKIKVPMELSCIVNMVDRGGSSGELLDAYGNILSPGDLRNVMIALASKAPDKQVLAKLFKYRFQDGPFEGANVGNLCISALDFIDRDHRKAVDDFAQILSIEGKVIPATWEQTWLCAKLNHPVIEEKDKGKFVEFIDDKVGPVGSDLCTLVGQGAIAYAGWYRAGSRVENLYLRPEVNANPDAITAIKQADIVIIGPGDIYSSVLPIFLKKGMNEAFDIGHTKALVIYMCNIMTKVQGTSGFSVADHVKELEKYLGKGRIDVVIYNNVIAADHARRRYQLQVQQQVRWGPEEIREMGYIAVGEDLLDQPVLVRHHPAKTARLIMDIGRYASLFEDGSTITGKEVDSILSGLEKKGHLTS